MTQLEPLIFSQVWVAVAVGIIVICGAIVQAGLGMGFGLTVAPTLALLDPALVPGTTLYLGLFTAVRGVVREPRAVVRKEIKVGALGRFIGVCIGALILMQLTDLKTFSLVFGIVVGVAVLMTAIGWHLAFNTGSLLSMSAISGIMGIITSVGAPSCGRGKHSMYPSPTLAMKRAAVSKALMTIIATFKATKTLATDWPMLGWKAANCQ